MQVQVLHRRPGVGGPGCRAAPLVIQEDYRAVPMPREHFVWIQFAISGHLGQPVLAGGKGHDAGHGSVLSVTLPVSLSPLLTTRAPSSVSDLVQ